MGKKITIGSLEGSRSIPNITLQKEMKSCHFTECFLVFQKRIFTSMIFMPQDAFNFWLIESDYKSHLFNVNRNPVRLQPFHLSHSVN